MMVTIVKLLTGIILTLIWTLTNSSESVQRNDKFNTIYLTEHRTKNIKVEAFNVLKNKCNVCHQKRNRRRVFTLENMNSWANDINKQVFIKKRMPKGKKIKLTPQEYQDLLTWISSNKTSNNGI